MTAPEWTGTAVCVLLLLAAAWGEGRWTDRRKREGRR